MNKVYTVLQEYFRNIILNSVSLVFHHQNSFVGYMSQTQIEFGSSDALTVSVSSLLCTVNFSLLWRTFQTISAQWLLQTLFLTAVSNFSQNFCGPIVSSASLNSACPSVTVSRLYKLGIFLNMYRFQWKYS